MARNIILTGIPRSGTTLTCSLLNKVPNTLAMVEPLNMADFNACADSQQRIEFLQAYFLKIRDDIAKGNKINILDIAGDGTNTFQYNSSGARETQIKGRCDKEIAKELDAYFTLIIKHPNIFTALLGELKLHWECYAIVRNPLSIFASWASLAHPLSNGHAPMAEHYDADLREKLSNSSNKFYRQLALMNWYYDTYRREVKRDNVIRYEDIVASSGAALTAIIPNAKLVEPLQSYNRRPSYDKQYMAHMMDLLLVDKCGGWRDFYSIEDLSDVVK